MARQTTKGEKAPRLEPVEVWDAVRSLVLIAMRRELMPKVMSSAIFAATESKIKKITEDIDDIDREMSFLFSQEYERSVLAIEFYKAIVPVYKKVRSERLSTGECKKLLQFALVDPKSKGVFKNLNELVLKGAKALPLTGFDNAEEVLAADWTEILPTRGPGEFAAMKLAKMCGLGLRRFQDYLWRKLPAHTDLLTEDPEVEIATRMRIIDSILASNVLWFLGINPRLVSPSDINELDAALLNLKKNLEKAADSK